MTKTKADKGSIGLMSEKNRLKVNFPRQYFPGLSQIRKGLQLSDSPSNRAKAVEIIEQLQIELKRGKLQCDDGNFNESRYLEVLAAHGVITLTPISGGKSPKTTNDTPPKPRLGLIEIWDRYCEYKKPSLRETVFVQKYTSVYQNSIVKAIKETNSEDGILIRNWLVKNRDITTVKNLLSQLEHAYDFAIKLQICDKNPYRDFSKELVINAGNKGKKQNEVETDNDVLDKSKAYTWEEVQVILNYCKEHQPVWLYNFLKFKFLTGCRTGEAIGFIWCDVLWDREQILFRRTYSKTTKKFYPLKNSKGTELIRIFPLPKNSELWHLLKSINTDTDNTNHVVFKSSTGKIIDSETVRRYWSGWSQNNNKIKSIIYSLIEQGQLTKYLPPYNTRHSFITHQVFLTGGQDS
ncbi:MAG: tyrosine recombinase XerC [Cuspidothrix sp.]